MPRSDRLPQEIAILRAPENEEPYFQVLRTHQSYDDDYYDIEDARHIEELNNCFIEELHVGNTRRVINKISVRNSETRNINEVYYWFTPFCIYATRGPRIPIVEFQHRSWIPRPQVPIYCRTPDEMPTIIGILGHIQRERLEEIRAIEDRRPVIHQAIFRQLARNPFRNFSNIHPLDFPDPDESYVGVGTARAYARRYRESLRPATPPPQPQVRLVEVEVPVERIVIERVAMPMPKPVADLLLANARKGAETCPILSIPFTDCAKLSICSCFHIFDKESLAKWQEDHNSCPVCRSKLENIVSE